MQATAKKVYETEGFRASEYLRKWRPQTSKLTAVLQEEVVSWKEAKVTPTVRKLRREPLQLKLDFTIDEQQFQSLVEQWRRETRHVSSLVKISMHPAYQRIIGFGRDALPFIFRELQERGGHWLWALNAITGEDPAPPDATFREAVQAWLNWGRRRGYLR